ncbi:MAG: patatin-like phospholipase family protein [Acidobacteria bacterium]|nr:patatin-like phospholipase family protein [Acidobacteriota bacterium]
MIEAASCAPGVTLVLGAGGARGVAHAAVLRRLRREAVPIDAIVGCSVGAIVGAMYAAVGMDPDEMLLAARRLTAGSLLAFALSRWRVPGLSEAAGRRAGAIPEYLERLDGATFGRLHHNVRRLGVLTFDIVRREEVFALGGPGLPEPLPLSSAVKASAAIPLLFPPLRAEMGGRRRYLADAGWFTAVPIERAFAPPLRSRRVIAVDLSLIVCPRQARRSYWQNLQQACGDRLLVLRPDVRGCGTIFPRRGDPARLAEAGEAAVERCLGPLRDWGRAKATSPAGFLDYPGGNC